VSRVSDIGTIKNPFDINRRGQKESVPKDKIDITLCYWLLQVIRPRLVVVAHL
jgi:hypothetical protein